MSSDQFVALVKEIEATKGAQTAHERECAQRYKNIEESQGRTEVAVSEIRTAMATLAGRAQGAAWSANWKAWGIAGAFIMVLIGALAWTAGQLYSLEPARVAHETKK